MNMTTQADTTRRGLLLGLGFAALGAFFFTVLLDFLVGDGKGVMLPLLAFWLASMVAFGQMLLETVDSRAVTRRALLAIGLEFLSLPVVAVVRERVFDYQWGAEQARHLVWIATLIGTQIPHGPLLGISLAVGILVGLPCLAAYFATKGYHQGSRVT